MRTVGSWMFVVLAGCSGKGGDDDSSTLDATCDDVGTAPLGQVEATAWPAGLAEAIPVYNDLGGRWSATSSCGGQIALKFVPKTQEELLVVTEPWSATTLSCGCPTDPKFPDDTQLDAVALHSDFQFFVESFEDPALHSQTFFASGALYGGSNGLTFRACAVDDVDPILQSVYDQVTTILRVENGAMSGTLVLAPLEGPVETCDLSGFQLVQGL